MVVVIFTISSCSTFNETEYEMLRATIYLLERGNTFYMNQNILYYMDSDSDSNSELRLRTSESSSSFSSSSISSSSMEMDLNFDDAEGDEEIWSITRFNDVDDDMVNFDDSVTIEIDESSEELSDFSE